MGTIKRHKLQGVSNIVRFNWHYFAIALSAVAFMIVAAKVFDQIAELLWGFIFLALLGIFISVFISWYVYDYSEFYSFQWLKIVAEEGQMMVNINAGFDETSELLASKFPDAEMKVMDFYDPLKHTETSIKRARKAFSLHPRVIKISTQAVPIREKSVDFIFLIFAAHEIRNYQERSLFFKQLNRALKSNGRIILVEHLRDLQNFLAYNLGSFHFLPWEIWKRNFSDSDLQVDSMAYFTPFVKIITLKKYGVTS